MSSPTDANVQRIEKIARLQAHQSGPHRLQQPVGIIGPGDGGPHETGAAREVAAVLAQAGFAVICGGRGGVMAAASQGATEAGGIAIGVLPEEDARSANPYLSVAIPTGMGEMRNAIIARSSLFLVAIGGNMGTISEKALGLKWGKDVVAIYEDVHLPGAKVADCVEQLVDDVVDLLINKIADSVK